MTSNKTIKELNKELNEKAWYRLLKVLWVVAYVILLILCMAIIPKDFRGAIIVFAAFTVTYVGATVALKRAVCYAAYYITTGKILLGEKWYSLLLIALWGIPSIFLFYVLFAEVILSAVSGLQP